MSDFLCDFMNAVKCDAIEMKNKLKYIYYLYHELTSDIMANKKQQLTSKTFCVGF